MSEIKDPALKTQIVYQQSAGLQDVPTHYCPGCHHGIIHKLIAESLVEMDLLKTAVGICAVGCSVLAGDYINCDFVQAAHGRAPAVATAIKRLRPDTPVFTYQGDGDLASIGAAEIMHAAMRTGRPCSALTRPWDEVVVDWPTRVVGAICPPVMP